MKKVLSFILMSVLILAFSGCGAKEPAGSQSNGELTSSEPKPNHTIDDSKALPDSYPKEILPLARDAVILDVRENPANNGLEVSYVSDNNIDTLCDFYEGALKDAKDLSTDDTEDGYMITAKIDDVSYTVILDKNAMNPIPQYAGKTSVIIILTGLKGVSDGESQTTEGKGEAWPFSELTGVPELEGHISKILREDGIIRLEITVENFEKVKSYIGELTTSGFSFDTQPDTESDHMEFLAFKDSSMMSFVYKGEENFVSIEYQK